MRIKLDTDLIKNISLFQKITRVSPRDCIVDDEGLIFIIPEVMVSKAIGKSAANVKKIESILNRKIKIVGFNPNVLRFIKNVVFPFKIKEIEEDNGIITLTAVDSYNRGQLIGRNAAKLRKTEDIVKRYFKITEIKVK